MGIQRAFPGLGRVLAQPELAPRVLAAEADLRLPAGVTRGFGIVVRALQRRTPPSCAPRRGPPQPRRSPPGPGPAADLRGRRPRPAAAATSARPPARCSP